MSKFSAIYNALYTMCFVRTYSIYVQYNYARIFLNLFFIASSQFKFPLPTVEAIYNKLSGCFAAICESIKGQ